MTVLPSNFRVYVSVLIGHFGLGISFFCLSWSSPILAKLDGTDDNPLGRKLSSIESSIIASLPNVGGLLGSFFFGFIARKFGRRIAMISIGIPTLVAYPLLAVTTNIWEIYIARLLCGLTFGGFLTVDIMYFAEVSESSNRSVLGTAMMFFQSIAGVILLIIGPATTYFEFHVIFSVFSPVYLILAYLFLSESPFYLVQKDYKKAEDCLKKLRGTNIVQDELDDIKRSLENNSQAHLREMFESRALTKGLLIGCGLTIFQQLNGLTVVTTYCQEIFDEVEGGVPSHIAPILFSSILFLPSFAAPVLIQKLGIRIPLLASCIGIFISEFIFGSYFIMKDLGVTVSSLSWLPLCSILVFGISNSLGFCPIALAIVGEIFPMNYKEIATSVCATLFNTFAFLAVLTFPYLRDFFGVGIVFWIYGGLTVVCTCFSYVFVVETKGKTLNQIIKELDT
ncbi:hypothetical protein HHI36_010692 [Cryptolaemus montrouzieri]|uniref:Major facilitator superfamily (MFS) profile domain-containing protein n=1 Tax=Cryptolaemus montrouzieri TaxID=559131 RepID=A0ABD2MJJ6_9CUCU